MLLLFTAATAYRRTRCARAAERSRHTLRKTLLAGEDTELRTWTSKRPGVAHVQSTQAPRAAGT